MSPQMKISIRLTEKRKARIETLGSNYETTKAFDLGLTVLELLQTQQQQSLNSILSAYALKELNYE